MSSSSAANNNSSTPSSSSSSHFVAAIVFWLLSQFIMIMQCQSLNDMYGGGIYDTIPDAWFGCTTEEIYQYLDKLGPEGRRSYMIINALDFILYMPSYAILLWMLLLRQCHFAGISNNISLLIVVVVLLCDIIESFIFGYATRQFPNHRLDASAVTIASIANQGKWISLLLGLVMLVVLCVQNKFVVVVVVDGSAKSKTKKSAIHVE